jgi:phosphatidylserine decarboxylase
MNQHVDELFAALQRLLPQHTSSRLLAKIADSRSPWLKNFLIRQAIAHYGIDLDEAQEESPEAYPSFNAFFTRELNPQARPIAPSATSLASPADGAISQIGAIDSGRILQAKGHDFSVRSLLACSAPQAASFLSGSFCTIYLSPRDYHRVHIPFSGILRETRYIPGKLFSVNAATTREIPNLFARNERLCCIFDSDVGQIAVVLVGALFVAGIETVWQQTFPPGREQHQRINPAPAFSKGDEIGRFKFGSTVVVLTESRIDWNQDLAADSVCRMGEALGEFGGRQ